MENPSNDGKFFCILPWKHLMLQPNGKVYTCCEATSVDNSNSHLGDLQDLSIKEIWNTEKIKKIRLQLLSGQIPDQCKSCARLEAYGITSDRLRSNEMFKDSSQVIAKTSMSGEIDATELKSFDLRLSNVCNFACRSCNPEQSSKWAMDYQLLTGKFLSSPLTTRTFKNLAECDSFIEHNLCAERIFFAGGEPLLHAEHYQILNRLIQNDKTDCTLAYITNLSTLNLQKNYVIDYWKHFKNVELTISLDAIGKLGEYIRDGLNWNEFSNNIQQIKNEVPHVKLSVNITVSLLNLVDVPATVDYCLKELAIDSDSIILAPVTSPLVYRITLIPKGAKQKIATHLLKASENFPVSLKNQISGIVAYMLSADESDSWKLFLAHNKRIDQLRSQSFVTVSNLLNDIDN